MATDLITSDKPLTARKEGDQVALWHERISIAEKVQEDWAQESGAKRFNEEYEGKFSLFFQGLRGRIPVPPINEVFAYVQADIASTYNRDPYITVNPRSGTPLGAKIWEAWLNYEWRELKTKEEIECEILDKDLVGYAFHKTGHAVNSIGTGEQLKIIDETLYSRWVNWRDITWNIGAKRPPYDCLWMAQRIVRPLDQIKAKYPRAAKLEGCAHPDVDQKAYEKAAYKDDIKVGIIREVWDPISKQIYLLADGLNDKFLDNPRPWPEYLDEFPFLMYWDFAIPGKARPMSAIAPWEPQVLEEMVLLAQAINHAKRWNRQLFVQQGTIDPNSLDKFERGDDGAIIEVTAKLDEASFRFADFGQLPTDFYLIMDRLQAIRRNINGQPEFLRGGVTKTPTRTIGELNKMEAGAKGRQERKVDRLETHCENIARHMMAHMKANFDLEKVVKVVGGTPEEVIEALGNHYDPMTGTIKFTPEEIQGEYDVEVKSGSTLPMNKENRTDALEKILGSVAQVASRGPMSPFMNAVIQELLQEYDIKTLQDAYQVEYSQAQEAQAQQVGQQDVTEVKTAAEAAKRQAQAEQVRAETDIIMQDAALGPAGRALAERAKRPEPKPSGNGAK